MELVDNLGDILKIAGILFGLLHVLVAFVLYRDVLRINRVVKTQYSPLITYISSIYIILVLTILGLFIVV